MKADGNITATVRVIDPASGASVAAASGVSLAQSGDTFTFKGDVADHLFASLQAGHVFEISIRGDRGRHRAWRGPAVQDQETGAVTITGKGV